MPYLCHARILHVMFARASRCTGACQHLIDRQWAYGRHLHHALSPTKLFSLAARFANSCSPLPHKLPRVGKQRHQHEKKRDALSAQADIILSNCVVNLSPDKARVLAEAYRVLRPGGEFYFSDVYSDRRVSPEAQKNEVTGLSLLPLPCARALLTPILVATRLELRPTLYLGNITSQHESQANPRQVAFCPWP